MKKEGKAMKSKTRFKWKRQLALLCLGALCLGGCAGRAAPQTAVLTFPAQQQRDIAASVEFTA